MRKLILTVGVVILLLGGFLVWRASRPVLTPEQEVLAQLEDIRRVASARQVRGVLSHVTEDFKFNTMTKDELRTSLQGAFFQYRGGFQVDMSGVDVQVNGDQATSKGHYTIQAQADPAAPGQTLAGDFKFFWRREDGEWKVCKAEGDQPAL